MLGQSVIAPDLDRHLCWKQGLQRRFMDLWEGRCLFFRSARPVVGLTCHTRAGSRMPLACMAISTVGCFTAGD
jgi:hypothetical protein